MTRVMWCLSTKMKRPSYKKLGIWDTVAVGWDLYIPKKKEKFINIINRADSAMYRCKANMKQEMAANLDS